MDLLLQHSSVCSAQCEQGLETGGGGREGERVRRQKGLLSDALGQHVSHDNQDIQGCYILVQEDGKMGQTACAISSPSLMDARACVSQYTMLV